MVDRKDVVLLEAGGAKGTGFLIAPGMLVTALHVIAELDKVLVATDEPGRPRPSRPITATYYSEERGHWSEIIEFDPDERERWSNYEDWVVLRVRDAGGVRVWDCDRAREPDRNATCAAYGFPVTHGDEGTPLHGELTGIRNPRRVASTTSGLLRSVPLHKAWFKETIGQTVLSPKGNSKDDANAGTDLSDNPAKKLESTSQPPSGFSGGPVVVGGRAIGIVRSFMSTDGVHAMGATVDITPIEPVLVATGVPAKPQHPVVEMDQGGVVLFEGPRQVPARSVPHFKGRDDELAELEQLLLGDNRTACVVATGIGGIGKTTLAEEFVATRAPELFPDGVAWLDGGELVGELGRVSRRFGWVEERSPTPTEALSLLGTVLHSKPVLFVVDNFDPKHGDVGHVPAPGGRCRTLVTSRARTVNVRLDAFALELGVWAIDACREYLRERCPRLQAVADAEVDGLSEFVGRLPLGVRLLVSLVTERRSSSPAGVLGLLEKQQLGALDKFDRDRGVAATFQFSYGELGSEGRRVLQALAVCAKQTRAATVEAVAGALKDDVGELLDDLHARSLAEFSADAAAPWGLHDVVRMFVLEQPGREEFEAAHTSWVRAHMKEHADATAHQEFATGVAEARRAFERLVRTNLEKAGSVYAALETHLTIVGEYPEAMALNELFLRSVPASSRYASIATNRLALCYCALGDIPRAIELHERALAIDEQLNRLEGQADALGNLGTCYGMQGDIRKAIKFLQGSLAIDEQLGRLEGQAVQLGNLGICYQTLGDMAKAIDVQERALVIDEQLGRLEGQARQLANLGLCHQALGDISKAIDFLQRALAIDEQIGRLEGQARQLGNLGSCYCEQGNTPKAIDFLQRGLAINEQLGNLQGQATQLGNLGTCYQNRGDIPDATEFHQRSLAINEQLGLSQGQATELANLGLIAAEHGTPEQARDHLIRALELWRRMGRPDDHPHVVMVTQTLAKLD